MLSDDIRVLVVDDSAVVRSIIAESIAATPGMKVVGTAGETGEDGPDHLRTAPTLETG